jgi:hypothetical protein
MSRPRYEAINMSTAVTPRPADHSDLGPLASRLVDVDAMPWQPTRFPGVEIKPLLCSIARAAWRAR